MELTNAQIDTLTAYTRYKGGMWVHPKDIAVVNELIAAGMLKLWKYAKGMEGATYVKATPHGMDLGNTNRALLSLTDAVLVK